jgi:endonuclease/exonuclease/phosphatase (EEP) superfamily protein YafD
MTTIEIARLLTFSIGYIIIFFSLLPLIKSDYWAIRVFDYPRSQKFWLNTIILVLFLFLSDFGRTHDVIFMIALFLNELYLLSLIWSYTLLASNQMKKNPQGEVRQTIKILIANVFQENKNATLCNNLITQFAPDIVLLVETDERWVKDVQPCVGKYPYRVLQPQANTYGMVLFSKLEIVKYSVRFLVEADVPSITADIKTKDGKVFRLYCLHPKPPVPGESENSTERDAEILIIGKEAKKLSQPVIVAGDLNDVAWSYTTNLFLKVSELLDPRIGRGFFSTYNAKYKLLRWPLDHVFCSSHFYLHNLRRLPTIDSDHFPIFIEVSLMPYEIKSNAEDKKEADQEDHELAEEKIDAAL